jgi:hypothetical protein
MHIFHICFLYGGAEHNTRIQVDHYTKSKHETMPWCILGCGWRRKPPDVKDSCEYIE